VIQLQRAASCAGRGFVNSKLEHCFDIRSVSKTKQAVSIPDDRADRVLIRGQACIPLSVWLLWLPQR
jgi:hypothetical protein